jgi:hypothetical protein
MVSKRDLPIVFTERNRRPPFEKMIEDLMLAMRQWDSPSARGYSLHGYSRVLLYMVGATAISEAIDNAEAELLRWPHVEDTMKKEIELQTEPA